MGPTVLVQRTALFTTSGRESMNGRHGGWRRKSGAAPRPSGRIARTVFRRPDNHAILCLLALW